MCAMTHAIGNIVASRWWGYLADKYGNKPILTMVGVLMLATPLPWLACRPDSPTYNMIVLVVCHVWMGMAWSGIMVCQFNLLLATSKPADRPTYIGTGLAVQSLAGAMAPYLGAELLAQARGWVPTSFGAYHIVFWVTIGIRFVGLLLLGRIREEGSTNVKATFKVLTGVTPRGLKAMRSFSRSGDAVERQTAIGEMAERGLRQVLQVFHVNDTKAALAVWECDVTHDEFYNSSFCLLLTYMLENTRNIAASSHLSFVAKHMECIGDHATNIAENIFYQVHGKTLIESRPKRDTTSTLSMHNPNADD
jgi:MFS family permease